LKREAKGKGRFWLDPCERRSIKKKLMRKKKKRRREARAIDQKKGNKNKTRRKLNNEQDHYTEEGRKVGGTFPMSRGGQGGKVTLW